MTPPSSPSPTGEVTVTHDRTPPTFSPAALSQSTMASSAPNSPRLLQLQTRPPLLTTRSIPSSPSSASSSTTAALLSPRRARPGPGAGFAMPPPSPSSSFAATPPSSTSSHQALATPPGSATNVAGTLRVEVMSARNLHAAVLGSLLKWTANTSNPYVVVKLHRDEFTTTTKDKTLNPTWKEMGHLKVPLPSEQELLQTVGLHRSVFDTGSGHLDASSGKLSSTPHKLQYSKTGVVEGGSGEFHSCYPHLYVQVFHQTDQLDTTQQQESPRSRRSSDKLIGEVRIPILPCLMSSSSSHRSWYTLLSDEHPDAGQIQIAMHYDVGGLEPLKGDIVRLAGFGGMEYYSKLVNANARLEVTDVFQDEVLVQYKSIENWMLSFEVHRNLLFVVRRPSMLRDAQSQLQGQIVRVRQSPLVTKAHKVWQAIPQTQRQKLQHLYQLAVFSGAAAYTVASKSVSTTLNDGVSAGVRACVNGSSEAASQVSLEALRLLWNSQPQSGTPRPTRTEEMNRYLEGGPLSGRGRVVQAFGDVQSDVVHLDEEEKVEEDMIMFAVEAEEVHEEYEAEEDEVRIESNEYEEESKVDENDDSWGDDVPDQLICPITGCPMVDPVVAADGHSYEREAILQWFAGSNKSPMTGAQMETTQVFSNFTLKRMSEELRERRRATQQDL